MWRIAAGYLAMTLTEYEGLTPRELQWRIQASVERENREFERLAQLACWVINPWLGNGALPLTPRRLLRPAGRRRHWDE